MNPRSVLFFWAKCRGGKGVIKWAYPAETQYGPSVSEGIVLFILTQLTALLAAQTIIIAGIYYTSRGNGKTDVSESHVYKCTYGRCS